MNDNDADQRRIGFMNAIGLLLENAEPATKAEILRILGSLGPDLAAAIIDDSYVTAASAAIDPCPDGFHWDEIRQMCVPD